jgi:hypothetical protein
VSKWIIYQTINWLPAQTIAAYDNALNEVIWVYKQPGFKVTTMSCDHEYLPLMKHMQEKHNIKPNYPSVKEHVPEAEHNNCY